MTECKCFKTHIAAQDCPCECHDRFGHAAWQAKKEADKLRKEALGIND